MHLQTRLAAVLALLLPLSASALQLTFYGRKPPGDPGEKMKVAPGVEAGRAVVFDAVSDTETILRPARKDETSNKERAVYRFEWQSEKVARFYELADPKEIERLTRRNKKDAASAEGKAYEIKVIQRFFDGSKVLQKCLPPGTQFKGGILAYFEVTKAGSTDHVVVLPEGHVAECITENATKSNYPLPPKRFTAKAAIQIKG